MSHPERVHRTLLALIGELRNPDRDILVPRTTEIK
jgi:hypothetical protein